MEKVTLEVPKEHAEEVAEFFNEVLLDEDYANSFKTVVFAIIKTNTITCPHCGKECEFKKL